MKETAEGCLLAAWEAREKTNAVSSRKNALVHAGDEHSQLTREALEAFCDGIGRIAAREGKLETTQRLASEVWGDAKRCAMRLTTTGAMIDGMIQTLATHHAGDARQLNSGTSAVIPLIDASIAWCRAAHSGEKEVTSELGADINALRTQSEKTHEELLADQTAPKAITAACSFFSSANGGALVIFDTAMEDESTKIAGQLGWLWQVTTGTGNGPNIIARRALSDRDQKGEPISKMNEQEEVAQMIVQVDALDEKIGESGRRTFKTLLAAHEGPVAALRRIDATNRTADTPEKLLSAIGSELAEAIATPANNAATQKVESTEQRKSAAPGNNKAPEGPAGRSEASQQGEQVDSADMHKTTVSLACLALLVMWRGALRPAARTAP
ncbi:hypothetical protein TRVL_02568 [Trypanosoma vivax]|nr:hypothetical protein TRVL_02568 [Trypanosoma vivax]